MMKIRNILHTGLHRCYDVRGVEIDCCGTGQDAETGSGLRHRGKRFVERSPFIVEDKLTGLHWTKSGSLFDFPVSWQESLALIEKMNRDQDFGRDDWRLPNRRELRSLVAHGMKKPALPPAHPFVEVNLGWYWSSTTAARNRAYAWYLHFEGGRMFYGKKTDYYWAWPVAGKSSVLPRTGEIFSEDNPATEEVVPAGADGSIRSGKPWPENRFRISQNSVCDALTGLVWYRGSDFTDRLFTWSESFTAVKELEKSSGRPWRVPTINELESLVDVSCFGPALPAGHPFAVDMNGFWSSTTSGYEKDWSFVLYMDKGAVGVGYKQNRDFYVWPVHACAESEDFI